MRFPHLFSTGKFGSLEVKNRLVMAPMVRNYADNDGKSNDRYEAHIERIAAGGVGTIILEASFVSQEGKGFVNQLGVHDDAMVHGLRRLAAAAHRHGAAIGIQLYHGGRQTSSKISGQQPIAPSALPDPTVNELPRQMSVEDVRRVVSMFGAAARRAKEAGCDFVEIHGAHGYLITQFLSPFSNRRKDAYGGSVAKRMRFLIEVYEAVRVAVGAEFPILVRLSGDEMVKGGIGIKDTVVIAKRLEAIGVNGLHISAGNYASYARGYMIPPMAMPDGVLVYLAQKVKYEVSLPVITVSKIRDAKFAESLLAKKTADFIALGRPLLADPEWPKKVREGRMEEIMPCIACNQGCISRLFEQKDVWCTVNPETGRERDFAKPASESKTVVVIGGGPAGLAAAKTAAQRGHKVTLFEKRSRLGGQLFAASAAPHREGWEELRKSLARDVVRLGVDIRVGAAFGLQEARAMHPDAVIIATGSSSAIPKIPGIGKMQVMTSREVLEGRKKGLGRRVVVAGGGCAGAQTAEALATDGHQVTIIEASGDVATDAPIDDRTLLLGRLKKLRVDIRTQTSLMSIGEKDVSVENHAGPGTIKADGVILCLGSYPNDGFAAELKGLTKKVIVVGDAVRARRVTEAIEEGALAALSL